MINRNTDNLYRQLDDAKHMMKDIKSVDSKVALANYIGNLYSSIVCMGDGSIFYNRNKAFGNRKNYIKFIKKIDIFSDIVLCKYILKKDFHKSYLEEIIPDIEDEMCSFCSLQYGVDEDFKMKDFFDVLFLFMKSIGEEKLFSDLYDNDHIYSTVIGQDSSNLGYALYNPITRSSDVFIRDFKYDLTSMFTLVHEFGHVYDCSKFDTNVNEYNKYFYISFYGEVLSRLFERLLFKFLLDNNIKVDTVKDKLIDFEANNHDYLLQAYIFSLLDDDFLAADKEYNCDSSLLAKKVEDNFLEDANIEKFIKRMGNFDLSQVYNYAYGDIISMFFVDEVLEYGLSSDMIEYFLRNRCKAFDDGYLRECGFGPLEYIKLYKKEIEVFKK